MPLDPFLAAKVHLIEDIDWARAQEDPALLARLNEFFVDPEEPRVPDVVIEDRTVPGPHGEVDVRLYRPHAEPQRALVWVHGGGFAAGDLDMPEAHLVAAELAARADAFVLSVGYRLAGDGVHYPVPIDDVHAAWRWFTGPENAERLPSGPVALGGASAGAALALSAAIRLRDGGGRAPDALLLAYPFVHFPNPALDDETASADELDATVDEYVQAFLARPPVPVMRTKRAIHKRMMEQLNLTLDYSWAAESLDHWEGAASGFRQQYTLRPDEPAWTVTDREVDA